MNTAATAAVPPVVAAGNESSAVPARAGRARGAVTLLLGYAFCLLGFVTMLGFAGTPASHSLTGSVPVSRAGMAWARPISSVTWAARSCSPFSDVDRIIPFGR